MTGFTVSAFLSRNRVSPKEAFEGLELCEGKLSCTVLRGLDGSNPVRLLGDSGGILGGEPQIHFDKPTTKPEDLSPRRETPSARTDYSLPQCTSKGGRPSVPDRAEQNLSAMSPPGN